MSPASQADSTPSPENSPAAKPLHRRTWGLSLSMWLDRIAHDLGEMECRLYPIPTAEADRSSAP